MADDPKSLLELSRARAAQARERYHLLAQELYGTPRGLLADAERSLMTGMIAGLVESIAAAQRPILLARLAGGGAYRAAAGELATEGIIGALCGIGFLTDAELIESAYHRLLEHRVEALARARNRPAASEPRLQGEIASAPIARLVEGASFEVAHALTGFLVWQSKRHDGYFNPLLLAADLPPALVRRLAWAVGAAHREALARDVAADDPALDDAVEAAVLGALEAMDVEDPGGAPPELAARRLVDAGLARPGSLVPLLEAGEVALFEAILARLAGIDKVLLRRFLFEPGGEAIAICARALDLGRGVLAAILEITRAARQRPRATDSGEAAAALALHDRISAETAGQLVKRWARNRDYLWALKRFEGSAGGGEPKSKRGL